MSDWTGIAGAVEESHPKARHVEVDFRGMNKARVTLRCPWGIRYQVAADIINNNRLWPDVSIGAIGGHISIDPAPNTKQVSVSSGGIISYEEALLTVDYDVAQFGNLEKDVVTGQIYSENIEPTIEHIKMDPHGFRFGTALGPTLKEPPVRESRGLSLVRTLYNLPTLPASLLTLSGHVNSAPYTSASLGLTFAAETLLFVPPQSTRVVKTDGSRAWTVPVKFMYKKDTWNKIFRPDTATFEVIWNDATGAVYKPYPPDDFSDWLF